MWLCSAAFLYLGVTCVLSNCPEKLCTSEETCCPTVLGIYGCCLVANATCCPDGLHCCPKDTTCELDPTSELKSRCSGKEGELASNFDETHLTNVNDSTLEDDSTDPFPGRLTRLNYCTRSLHCPNTYTCCLDLNGDYNCCPPKSVCCSNSGHCCPEGTECDLITGRCRPSGKSIRVPIYKRRGLIENYEMNEANINLCDKESYCPDEQSCCMGEDGRHGCCPYRNAVCCRDRLHCCQEGEVCDAKSELCIRDEKKMPPFVMEKAVPFLSEEDFV